VDRIANLFSGMDNRAAGVDHRRTLFTGAAIGGRVDISGSLSQTRQGISNRQGMCLSSVFFVKFSPSSDQGEDVSTVIVCNGHLRKFHKAARPIGGPKW